MTEELKGTSLEKGRGDAEFSEVEELIRQTLEESKKSAKPAAPSQPAEELKKDEFKATAFVAEPKPQPVAPPLPARPEMIQPIAKEKDKAQPAAAAPSEYEQTFKEYKVGDIVKGKVLKVDQSGVLVDIKYKADGLILPEELAEKIPGASDEVLKVGDIINVMIENLENKEGYAVLSKKNADYEIKWNLASDAYRNKSLLSGKVLQALKGGLVVDCQGIRGFVPASQVSKTPEESFDSFIGQSIPLKVIEVNRRLGKIVLSHKAAAGEKGKLDNQKIFDELEVGQIRHGKVANLKSFGAFVDLGGVEGLIHLSELSWKRVKHPSEVLKSGEEIDVFVLGVDRVNRKVSLGLKELQPDPWVNAADLYKPGQIVKAKVLRFAKFGAFVELEHGLEGLIHVSEISRERIEKPEDAIKIGDVVDVKILRVIPEEQKIGLSIKGAQAAKEKQAARTAPAQPAAATEEKKVTIADMIADKERARAEKESTEEESEPAEEAATEEEAKGVS